MTPKAWGSEVLIANRAFCGKILCLDQGYRCSAHYHAVKDETFLVIWGRVLLETWPGFDPSSPPRGEPGTWRNRVAVELHPGDSADIPPGTLHRFTGLMRSRMIEFSTTDAASDSYRVTESGAAPNP